MRMTHHFVAPADIRWLLALLAPRMMQRAAPRWRELDLDDKTFGKSHELLARVLEGGKQLTRHELVPLFTRARISPAGQRMPHLLARAELAGLICSGARKGKQITFALLDDRVPRTKLPSREASLAELAKRYFTTRGPATIQNSCGGRASPLPMHAPRSRSRVTLSSSLRSMERSTTPAPPCPRLAYRCTRSCSARMTSTRSRTEIGARSGPRHRTRKHSPS